MQNFIHEAAFIIRTGSTSQPYYLWKSRIDENGEMVNYWTPFITNAKHDFQTYNEAKELADKIWANASESIKMHGLVVITRPVCPKCGQVYNGAPALSRDDNKTKICSDCGNREAFKAFMEAHNDGR